MYKKSIMFLLLGSWLFGSNAKQIVALEYAVGTVSQKYGSTSETPSVTHYGFKLGAKENDMRLFLSYRYQSMGSSDTGHHAGLEFDSIYQLGPIGIFVGPVVGYSWYDFTGQDSKKRQASLAYYGANSGLVLSLGALDVDIGARYAYYSDATISTVTTQVYTINSMLTYYVGLSYLY